MYTVYSHTQIGVRPSLHVQKEHGPDWSIETGDRRLPLCARFVGRADLQFDWRGDGGGRAKRPRVVADELEPSEMKGSEWDAEEVQVRARRVKLRRSAVSRMPPPT